MADSIINPLRLEIPLANQHQHPDESVALPTCVPDDPDSPSGREGNDGSEKGRKLNLWKCKQCREARKKVLCINLLWSKARLTYIKCFPADRVWPQKCQRCLQHRPEAHECSEPQLNTRKRGPNLSKPAHRSKSRSTEGPEPRDRESDEDSLTNEASTYNRPTRTPQVKEKYFATFGPVSEISKAIGKKDQPLAFAYLPLGDGEFRILRLAPGRKEDKIVCSFLTTSLRQALEYETISNIWGGAGPRQQSSIEIELRDSQVPSRPRRIFIRSNLCSALQRFRHPSETRLFWVDTLCINRGNVDETNRQVAMKGYIFRNAANVCFWLGEDAISKVALNFIPQVLNLARVDKLVRDEKYIEGWDAFLSFLKNPAFGCVWPVQEVAVARNVTMHCGRDAIHYADFVDAVAMFTSCRADVALLFPHSQEDYRELTDPKIMMAERFIDVTTNALRAQNSAKAVQRLLSLETLVSQLGSLSAKDPRDRIFSVIGLAKDGLPLLEGTFIENHYGILQEGPLRIDYDKSILEVYQDFVIHAIGHSQSLDIICRNWASLVSDQQADLPTWIRPLSERTDAESLVGLPEHSYYNASGSSRATVQTESYASLNNRKSLVVTGFRVDTISKLGPRALEGIILCEWLELGGCFISDNIDIVPEAFWRTLVADRSPNGSNPPPWYHRALLHCLAQSAPNGDIDTNRLIAEAGPYFVVEFLRRVQSVIWNRKFLISKFHDWIGLAPIASEVGDVLCILYGCSVPVVLRPHSLDGKNFWHLVGECYLHGMMNGEAVETDSRYEVEKFELM
jgi:hypothetical protein